MSDLLVEADRQSGDRAAGRRRQRVPDRRGSHHSGNTRQLIPQTCVLFSCLAVFGLELTVGVTWALPLDIGGDYAGSVSAVMNTLR